MSKAIQGVAMLGGAIAMGTAAFFDPALLASPLFDKAFTALVLGGISMEAGALASALTSNRGTNITTRQAAAFRQVVYGEQRVGGIMIYESTTGSHHDQYNYVIVLAGHEIDSIVNLYLDGRQVFWAGGVGNVTRNGVNFGGAAAGSTHTGPGGQQYNFGGLVYCEARFGDQLEGDVIGGLTANDPTWAADANGSPWVGGCAYVYLKIEYDQSMFASAPEIRFTVRGKNNIFDPRTGTAGYSTNAALIVADVLTDTQFGLGDVGSVNTAQLIAAANVCDEQVPLAAIAGSSEARYALHWHYDTATAPGDVLQQMLPAMGGRLSRVGGEWYITPAYWQGPSFEFGPGDLADGFQWKPYRPFRELVNRVTGTYIAPNFPYNILGNVYDANGFYEGEIQNNFNFAFQPTNFPQYAADVLHGYPADEYLLADGGQPLPMELALPCVLSISQAQRLAKIALMRNRQQGSGVLTMFLQAYQMMPTNVFHFTFPKFGWAEKVLEANSIGFSLTEGKNGAPALTVQVGVNETAASVYEWNSSEELTIYDVPASPQQAPYIPAPPTNMTLTSSAATAIVGADGVVRPRVMITWDEPLDGFATQIQVAYQLVGASTWTDAPPVPIASVSTLVDGVVAGSAYNFRIRSMRANGATSAWTVVAGYTVSLTLSILSQLGVGIGSLIGEAFGDGTAAIVCGQFTAIVGSASVLVLPAGYTITGLQQAQLYYVYYDDPNFTGGAVTPVATQNQSDFLNHVGRFLIDSIVTPVAAAGGGAPTLTRYSPGVFHDLGSRTTVSPEAAFDGNSSSAARLSATSMTRINPDEAADLTIYQSSGDCLYQSFANVTLGADATLNVIAELTGNGNGALSASIVASIGGTAVTLHASTTAFSKAAFTANVPAGTAFLNVTVEGTVTAADDGDGSVALANLLLYEIYIAP